MLLLILILGIYMAVVPLCIISLCRAAANGQWSLGEPLNSWQVGQQRQCILHVYTGSK